MKDEIKFQLRQTCGACPEACDVYLDGRDIGMMRLRHGSFRAEYQGQIVYTANPRGDGLFEDEDERSRQLNAACRAIRDAVLRERGETVEEENLFEIVDEAPSKEEDP